MMRQKDYFGFRGPAGVCLGQLPYFAPELFIGRSSELDKIAEFLHPVQELQKQQRLVLGGMGGTGKTRLANAYANSRSGFYSSVFWLNAASEAALKESFRSIASLIFEIQDVQHLENKVIIGCVHQWLSDLTNTRWLLIFDNYDDPDLFRINDYYPPTLSHGAILITTRRPDLVGGNILHVEPFQNIENSLAVLQTRSRREDVQSDPHAKCLAKRLAGLPLALATAGIYLQRSTFTFERYLQEYEKRWNIDPRHPTQLQEYHERTLYTTWDLSYTRLKTKDSDAAQVLKVLAYFGNQSIWYKLFHGGLSKRSPDWLRELVTDDVSFQRVMRVLTEYYFLEVHLASESWSMHNCVHDWTLATLNKSINMEYFWYAFDCMDVPISEVDPESFGCMTFSRLAGHASRLLQHRFLEKDVIYDFTPDQLVKFSRASRLLYAQTHFAAAEQMYIRALSGYEKALGPDDSSTIDIVNDLGNVYRAQDKLGKAKKMYMRALAAYEKALGPDHTSTLNAVKNLGILYSNQGKLNEAEQMYIRALAGYNKARIQDPPSTLDILQCLGNLYRAQSKLDKAEQLYAQALAGYEKALGLDHTSTLNAVHNLGNLYYDQGKLGEAEMMYMRALAGYETALGPQHTSILNAINNLGNLYRAPGRFDEAEKIYMRVLAGKEKMLGQDHTSTLHTVQCLRNLYYTQGKLVGAEHMYMRTLIGYEKRLGLEHTSTLNPVHNLGNLYYAQGHLSEAEKMYMRALAGYERALGPDHVSTLDAVNSLGNLYCVQGKLDEAEKMYIQALAGKEKVLGSDHSSTLNAVQCLAILYSNQCKLNEAEQMYLQALDGYRKGQGLDYSPRLNALQCLRNLYRAQGKLDEAERIYMQALTGYEKTLGVDHASTLHVVNNLGNLYSDQGRRNEAEQMYMQALAGYEKALGPDHTSTVNTVKNLAHLHSEQGNLLKAARMLWRAGTKQ